MINSISSTYYFPHLPPQFLLFRVYLKWANSLSSIWVGDHEHCHACSGSFVFWNMQKVSREISQTRSKDALKNYLFWCLPKSEASDNCTYIQMVKGCWPSVSLSQASTQVSWFAQAIQIYTFPPDKIINRALFHSIKGILVWMINYMATLLIRFLQTFVTACVGTPGHCSLCLNLAWRLFLPFPSFQRFPPLSVTFKVFLS